MKTLVIGKYSYNVGIILKNFNIDYTLIFESGIDKIYKKSFFENINIQEYDNIYISGYDIRGKSGENILSYLSKVKYKNIFFRPGHKIMDIKRDILEKLFSLRPIIHINDEDALKYTKKKSIVEAARAINKLTKNTVFITLGKDGVMCASNCEYRFIDGIKTNIVNTIGAGDSHIGGIIAGYSMSYSLSDCCYLANKIASKVVSIEESILESKYFDINEYHIIECLEAK